MKKADNLERAATLIDQVVNAENPDWIGLPEVFDQMGGSLDQKRAAAEPMPGGPGYELMQSLARRHKVFIHAGSMLERVPGEARVGNTTIVFDRTGSEVARYRKIHMFDITAPDGVQYRESDFYLPGRDIITYNCEGLIFGCAICYDLRFPNLFQALITAGAQVIVLPAAFTLQTGKDHWEALLRARAIETETYICAPGQTGAHFQDGERRVTWGHSMIVDPWGCVTAQVSDGEGWVVGRLDAQRIANVRQLIPVAKHRLEFR